MLQEEQTVCFAPQYVDAYFPLYVRLFWLYLTVVTFMSFLRAIRIGLALRKRRATRESPKLSSEIISADLMETQSIKAKSLRSLAHLTLLISLTVLVWSSSDNLTRAATQKTVAIGAIAGAFAESLRTFSAGLITSIVLLCLAAFCEHLIRRRKPRSPETAR